MDSNSLLVNSTFDPYTQPITIYMSDNTPITFTLLDLDTTLIYNYAAIANFSIQFGACLIMLIVVVLITSASKRKTLVFALNVAALIIAIVRNMMQILYWSGPFSEIYNYFSGDFSKVSGSAFRDQVGLIIISWSLLVAIELSLLLQVHILFKGLQNPMRHAIMLGISITVALLAIAFRLAVVVANVQTVVDSTASYHQQLWIASGALIMQTVSIWYFCIIFTGKLVYHILRQRQMKATIFKPLQILSIMSGCTMIIPSIFAIFEYLEDVHELFPEAGTIAVTAVAIMLPLSSSWASASTEDPTPRYFSTPGFQGKVPSSNEYTNVNGSAYDRKGSEGNRSNFTSSNFSPVMSGHAEFVPMGALGRDVDLEEGGISVEKTYSVRSGVKPL